MNLRTNFILPESKANGPGLRYVIWTQGCSIHCPGCSNQDTWDFNAGRDMDVDQLVTEILNKNNLDGVTITGGEPLDQFESVLELCQKLFDKTSIFLTTGYWVYEIVKKGKIEIANYLDIICAGPFESSKLCRGEWKGSSNQSVVYLTERGVAQARMPVVLKEIYIKEGSVMETGFTV